ncbi:hypothetical protein EJ08DRAFT_598754, partial [Tothia fuscella]
SGLYAVSPWFLILTLSLDESLPSLMKLLREPPRFVAAAFPPKHRVSAVRTALFPLPLCPIMKLMSGPILMMRFS